MPTENRVFEKIRRIQKNRKSGVLQLGNEGESVSVYFDEGRIAAAGSSIVTMRIGEYLERRGFFENGTRAKLLESARRKHMLLGQAAVRQHLLDEHELRDAVREQAIHVLSHAISNGFEDAWFTESTVDMFAPAELNFDSLVLELARSNVKPARLNPNQVIRLVTGKSLSHLPWYPQELSVLSRLDTPRTMQDLVAVTGIEGQRLGKILCLFDSLGLLGPLDTQLIEPKSVVQADQSSFRHLIPEIGGTELSDKLEAFYNPASYISEQFKTLKVRLAEASAQAPLQAIAVSSPDKNDGKSLICLNLAISLSRDSGRRVVLVDCDLRNPSLHRMLGVSMDPGLFGYLDGDDLPAYCYMRRMENLFLMTAGETTSNTVELLSNARMQNLVARLKQEFDIVILDCPPFGPVSDAQILTGLADGLLMVVRRGKTTYSAVEKAFRVLDKSKLVGFVFNDVKPMRFNTQYYYGHEEARRKKSHRPCLTVKLRRHSRTYLD
jgi:capsular exopolysaccharide synthesis family protein